MVEDEGDVEEIEEGEGEPGELGLGLLSSNSRCGDGGLELDCEDMLLVGLGKGDRFNLAEVEQLLSSRCEAFDLLDFPKILLLLLELVPFDIFLWLLFFKHCVKVGALLEFPPTDVEDDNNLFLLEPLNEFCANDRSTDVVEATVLVLPLCVLSLTVLSEYSCNRAVERRRELEVVVDKEDDEGRMLSKVSITSSEELFEFK